MTIDHISSSLVPPPALVSAGHCLLLDFDGTLVELAERPDAVVVDDPLLALLRCLMGTFEGRLALVSGRSTAQIVDFLGDGVPGIAIVGSHGAELELSDRRITPSRPAALLTAEQELVAAFAGEEGVLIEVKSLGVAVHYRLAPTNEARARHLAEQYAGLDGIVLQEGKMMVELRAGGHDKGTGIAALLEQPPFAGSTPIFVGDDVTDEAGLALVAARGGIGVLVGPERRTAARYRLNDVAAVRQWLGDAA